MFDAGVFENFAKKVTSFIALAAMFFSLLFNPGNGKPLTLSEGNRIILEKGIVLQAWVPASASGDKCLPAQELKELGFGPTYYESNMFNPAIHEAYPDIPWSLAQAPTGGGSSTVKPSGEEWMSAEQLKYANSLISVCFGDENAYSKEQTEIFRQWFDDFRSRHCGVLLHSNQWCGQWTKKQMTDYMKTAKPDLLTFDSYYFDEGENPTEDYEMGAVLADSINSFRKPAMAGCDGTGRTPIPFGQYLLGFKTGGSPPDTGHYEITESQKNAVANMTLTMGGKWLNLFRIIYGDFFLLYDSEGKPTRHYYEYAALNKEIINVSPHLSKLQTTDVRVIRGSHKGALNLTVKNAFPKSVFGFSRFNSYGLQNIKVRNTGSENDGLNGDVYIGYFKTLPGAAFESGKQRDYFALCNALATGNGLLPQDQHGSCTETGQEITLCVDSETAKKLYFVNAQTGETEQAAVIAGEYKFTLGGGKMRVFFWE